MRRSRINTTEAPVFRFELGGGFVLFFALLWFFDERGFLAALVPSIFAHELGHILFMMFFGAYPTRLKTALSGFEIDYSGNLSALQEMLTALAGPAFGLLFSVLCARLGRLWNSDYLLMCAGLGFVINAFNFLPAEPLDGGRVLGYALRILLGEEKARIVLRASGLLTSGLLAASGLYFLASGLGPALFIAVGWLFILQRKKPCNKPRYGIK